MDDGAVWQALCRHFRSHSSVCSNNDCFYVADWSNEHPLAHIVVSGIGGNGWNSRVLIDYTLVVSIDGAPTPDESLRLLRAAYDNHLIVSREELLRS